MITFKRMTRDLAPAAFELLNAFLREDEHYLASSAVYGDGGEPALRNALELFLQRPELGFVWLALDGERPVGVCFVCLAISTSTGTVVAKLEDVFVAHGWRSRGVGTQLLSSLVDELRRLGVKRVDTAVHFDNPRARRFYERNGFRSLGEERLARVIYGV